MQPAPLLTGTLALLALGVSTTLIRVPDIEADLEHRVARSLEILPGSYHRVEARGRAVLLTGVYDDAAGEVAEATESVWGVHVAETLPALSAAGPWLRARIVDGEAHLEGTVSDTEWEFKILAGARAGFAGRPRQFDLLVDETLGRPPTWPSTFEPLFRVTGRGIADLRITMDSEVLVVGGIALDQGSADSLGFQVVGAAPGLEVRNELEAAETFAEGLRAALAGRVIAFESESARLTPGSRRILSLVAIAMRSEEAVLRITGHATEGGTPARRMASARTRVVSDYLLTQGVARDRLETVVVEESPRGTVTLSAGG
ncbi:MAG: OmpA family protein [Gemmatimonadota bacterium]|nr:OmpA family protein [Gemmatimonadota bacterium]